MEESQPAASMSADEIATAAEEAADKTTVASEVATAGAEPHPGATMSEPSKAEVEQTLTRTQVISRLKAIVVELEGGSLVVDGMAVAELGETVDFELEYSDENGRRELEIELEW